MEDENEKTKEKIDNMTEENKGEVIDTKKVEESQPAPEKKSEDTKPEKHEETVETSEIKTKPEETKNVFNDDGYFLTNKGLSFKDKLESNS